MEVVLEHGDEKELSMGDRQEAPRSRAARTVNILSIVAAVLGAASIFFAWGTASGGPGQRGISVSLWDTLFTHPVLPYEWALGALFIASSLAVLYSPVAGFVQVISLALWGRYYLEFGAFHGGPTIAIVFYYSLQLGFWLGVVSAGMALVGLVHPVGPGLEPKTYAPSSRLLTVSRTNRKESEHSGPTISRS